MEILHDRASRRFHFTLPEGAGELTYEEPDPGVVELDHTWVDPAIRGRKLGDELAQAALDWARAEGKRVVPLCPFVHHYIDKHPVEKELLRR
jgi:predicted GNAT family acetyltransferase